METIVIPDHCHRAMTIGEDGDLTLARRIAAQLAAGVALERDGRERFNLIVAELGSNLLRYAPGGSLLLRRLGGAITGASGNPDGSGEAGGTTGLECLALDRGPGIANIERALSDGQSTGGSLGLGLGAVRRLSDEFAIHSEPGVGTAVLTRIGAVLSWQPSLFVLGAVMLPMAGMEDCGDGWRLVGPGVVMVIDGLGHGPFASEAARRGETALGQIAASADGDPRRILAELEPALKGTRGAAVAVAVCLPDVVRFAGVGNIGATLLGPEQKTQLVSSWGVLGHGAGLLAAREAPWSGGDLLLLHSDGIGNPAPLIAERHLRFVHPALAAAILLRDGKAKLDDQTIVVVRRTG